MTEEPIHLVNKKGENVIEREYLEQRLPQDTFLEDAVTFVNSRLEEKYRERCLQELTELSKVMSDKTETWWYDDIYALAGSSGIVVIEGNVILGSFLWARG